MNKKNLLFGFLSFVGIIIFGQLPAIEWQKSLGGSGYEQCYAVKQASDGGYIVSGSSPSNDGDVTGNHGSYDAWIVKLNASGAIDWQKSLGGSDDDGYGGTYVDQTNDGGYIIAGYTYSNNGDVSENHGVSDYWVVKLNGSGEMEWEKSFGGSGVEFALTVQQTSDGGYIVGGWSNSEDGDIGESHGGIDAWVLKLDGSGEIQWEKSLGGSDQDTVYSIFQTNDGGYILAGYSDSNDGDVSGHHGPTGDLIPDYWIVKLDSSGSLEWQKSLGGNGYDQAQSVRQTSDNGYIVAGYSDSNDGDVSGNHGVYDVWVVKLNNSGSIEWQKSLGGSDYDITSSVMETADGGYLIAASSGSDDGDVTGHHGNGDFWIVKLDSAGNLNWQECFGGSGGESAFSAQQTTDNGFIISGFTASDDGDVTGHHGGGDYWVVKLGPDLMGVKDLSDNSINIFPNPVIDDLMFSRVLYNIEIYTAGGQKVLSETGGNKSINVHALPLGIYLLKAETAEGKILTEKLIKK